MKSPAFHAHQDFVAPLPGVPTQGDMNGDGIMDLVVPSEALNEISLLIGNPDGTFQAPLPVEAGGPQVDAVVADFNSDGIKDLAAVTASGISIMLGEGGGNFQAPLTMPAGRTPERIIAADFNGDHIVDLAVANFDSSNVSIFLGNGDGSFAPAATVEVGAGPLGIAAVDLNGDRNVDLVVSNSGLNTLAPGQNANTIAVLLGTGKGTFLPAVFIPLKHHPEGIAVSDFNKDGKPDLMIALNKTDQVAELAGNGDGTFQPARLFTVFPQSQIESGAGLGPTNVALADFNGDGNIDLAIANSLTSTVGVLLGDGTGNFRVARNIEVSRTPVWVISGDYNRDGKPDFISANSDASTVSVVLGNGDGTFVEAPVFSVGAQPRAMVAADFNNDGVPDIATAGGIGNGPTNSLSILLGKKGGGFAPKRVTTLNANVARLVAADINHDGRMDLLGDNFGTVGSDPGGITVLLGNGDGSFQSPVSVPAGIQSAVIALADFNGDGNLDAVVSSTAFPSEVESMVILSGDGKGGFGAPSTIATFNAFNGISFLLAGDFNGDGKADIAYVLRAIRTSVVVQFGNGDGTFQAAKIVTTLPPNSDIFAFSTGDLNNDGNPDFAIEEGGVVEILAGNGKGSFVSKGKFFDDAFNSFSFVPAVLLADFNGDGLLDVAATDGFSDNVSMLLGNGDGTLNPPAPIFGGGHTAAAASADFNGDGRPDIVLATTAPTASPNSPGEVILLLNTTR